MKRTLVRLGLVAAIISTLAGCGGGGGSDGAPGASTTTTTVVTAPSSGTPAPVSLDNSVPPTAAQLTAWANMAPQATFAGGQVQSPPQIKFVLTDENGKAIFDLRKNKTTPAAPALPFYQDMYFTFAKFVPGTNGGPSKWVNMNMFKAPSAAQAAGTLGVSDLCVSAANSPDGHGWCATYPNYDREGTIAYDGTTYTYTFFRDFKKSAAIAAAMTGKSGLKDASGLPMSDDSTTRVADMGDLSWDPAATYRIAFMFYGNAPGTGSNTPDGSTSATAPTGVSTSVNTSGMFTYDFTLDNNGIMVAAANPARDIVNINSCAACHDGKGIGHSSRRDPKVCVTCHTEQVKTTFNNVAGEAPRATDGITLTGTASKDQAIVSGRAVGNYPNMVHKIHMGTNLTLQGYFFNANAIGNFNKYELPLDPNNCTKCHSGQTQASPLNAVQTTNGDNWKNVPTRLACGSCHDGINFATGLGITVSGDATKGHGAGLPGPQADDSKCVTCHSAAVIAVKHGTPVTTPNNPNLAAMGTTTAGSIATITYDLNSVSLVAAANGATGSNVQLKFRILKNGSPVTLNTPNLVTSATNGQQVLDPNFEPITGFAGGPSLYVAFAVPQDGITSPIDFNKSYSTGLANVLIPSGSPKAGSITGPDGSGYYIATLTGDLVGQAKGTCSAPVAPATATCVTSAVNPSTFVIPASAKLVTGAMIGTFTQKVATGYTSYVPANVSVNNVAVGPANTLGSVAAGNVATYGGVLVKSMIAMKPASTTSQRRVLVSAANCNRCHEQLGAREENTVNNVGRPTAAGSGDFHGAQGRNDPAACAICHNVTQTSGGWTSNASTFVHGIHAGAGSTTGNSSAGRNKRMNPYTWHATSATVGFWTDVIYPGVLADCNQCHVANAVNFTPLNGPANVANLLWPTTATGSITSGGTTTSPYVASGTTNYGTGFSFVSEGLTLSSFTTKSGVTLYKSDGTTVIATYAAGAVVPATVAPAGGMIVPADGATLVSSPIASSCFSCHDAPTASAHMTQYGGYLNVARATVGAANLKANPETCYICHGPATTADVAVVHHK